jgi:hypothetical protein
LAWIKAQLARPRHDAAAYRRGCDDATDGFTVCQYLRFIVLEAEEYLRSYLFLLLEGRIAMSGEKIPEL